MTDSLHEILRRVEILASVMNGDSKGRADFAYEYNVAEVTISRDLEWLRGLGIQIYSRKGRITVTEDPSKDILNGLAAEYLPIKLNSDVFLKKISVLSKLNNKNYFNYLTIITKAVNEGRYIHLTYRRLSDNEENDYCLIPVRLVSDDYNWMLHAFKQGETILKTFYLSRIQKLNMLNQKYQKAPNPEEVQTKEEIILRFHPSVEEEVSSKIWFEDFDITKDEQGYIILKTKHAITNRLAAWCISWWDKIELIESNKLKIFCKEMIESYYSQNIY